MHAKTAINNVRRRRRLGSFVKGAYAVVEPICAIPAHPQPMPFISIQTLAAYTMQKLANMAALHLSKKENQNMFKHIVNTMEFPDKIVLKGSTKDNDVTTCAHQAKTIAHMVAFSLSLTACHGVNMDPIYATTIKTILAHHDPSTLKTEINEHGNIASLIRRQMRQGSW